MGYTLIEKILIRHLPRGIILGDFVYPKVDLVLANDITGPLAVKQFTAIGTSKVFNRNKVVFVCDHFLPARDRKAANNVKMLKEFAAKYRIRHCYDIDTCGVEHAFLPERGFVSPGDLVIGADSHTCTYGALAAASFGVGSTDVACAMASGKCWFKVPATLKFVYKGTLPQWFSGKDLILFTIGRIGVEGALYKIMEFSGPVITRLDMDDRFTICNMAVEAGAKTGIIAPDKKTMEYISQAARRRMQGAGGNAKSVQQKKWELLHSDDDATYEKVYEYDVSELEPQVAGPYSPENVGPVSTMKKVAVDQVVIGSCTNGRISDLRIAARLLRGRKIHPRVRLIVIPATVLIYRQALEEGLLETFVNAGGIVSAATCGPCLGGHTGILAKGEVAVATTNRNFVARMGHPQSKVYLSSPAVAAATALKGKITHPGEVT